MLGIHSGPPAAPPPDAVSPLPAATARPGGFGGFGGSGGDDDPGHSLGMSDIPTGKFVQFLKISAKRAFRLRIEPDEVLASERAKLAASYPPITDPNLQAFLAWRRSVLFLVAVALFPLTVLGLINGLQGDMHPALRFVRLAPAVTEGLFCWICWYQIKRWASWREQRRWLFYGWLLFMLTPFIVFIYPLRNVMVDMVGSPREALATLGIAGVYKRAVLPFVFSMVAMIQLAPKAISLMPGLIRASLVIKLLFPGSTTPGWLIVMCSPIYALLAYVILIIPYQFTGSVWFIAGVLGVVAGQAVLARAGYQLARPMTESEALFHINKVRRYYMTVMVLSGIFIVIALGSLVQSFGLKVFDVITAVLKFETNVLILTLIGADLVINNLDKARQATSGRAHVEQEAEVKIAAFVSLDAPRTPPPGGPASHG